MSKLNLKSFNTWEEAGCSSNESGNRYFSPSQAQLIVDYQRKVGRGIDSFLADDIVTLARLLGERVKMLRGKLVQERKKGVNTVGEVPYLNMSQKFRGRKSAESQVFRDEIKCDEIGSVTLRLLDVSALNVAEAYQREVNKARVKKMVKDFSMLHFGTLVVGQREDGTLWVVDGQHRLCAARDSGRDAVPCVVFESEGKSHEAAVFMVVNRSRSSLAAIDAFRASLVEGAETAIGVQNIADKYGIKIGKATTWPTITAVNSLCTAYRQKVLPEVLDCLRTFDNASKDMQLCARKNTMIEMLTALIKGWGPDIDKSRLKTTLSRLTSVEWKELESQNSGSGGSRGRRLAQAFGDEYYNHSLRSNRVDFS